MDNSRPNDDQTELKVADPAPIFHVSDHFQLHVRDGDRTCRHVMRIQARFIKR